jgi:hypothetical protein
LGKQGIILQKSEILVYYKQYFWIQLIAQIGAETLLKILFSNRYILKLVVCILLRVLGQVQGFRLTQHWFEYFI